VEIVCKDIEGRLKLKTMDMEFWLKRISFKKKLNLCKLVKT